MRVIVVADVGRLVFAEAEATAPTDISRGLVRVPFGLSSVTRTCHAAMRCPLVARTVSVATRATSSACVPPERRASVVSRSAQRATRVPAPGAAGRRADAHGDRDRRTAGSPGVPGRDQLVGGEAGRRPRRGPAGALVRPAAQAGAARSRDRTGRRRRSRSSRTPRPRRAAPSTTSAPRPPSASPRAPARSTCLRRPRPPRTGEPGSSGPSPPSVPASVDAKPDREVPLPLSP